MKMMNFTMINVIVDREAKNVSVQRVENVPINVEQTFLILPEMIPSTISGPQGNAVGKMASKIVSGGGAAIVVDGTPKQNIKRIMDAFGIEVAGITEEEEQSTLGDDEETCNVLKLVVPDHVERSETETPTKR